MTGSLTDEQELLFRQVHPQFIRDGHPSSQPFYPTPKDGNKLSVDRSTITDAANSFRVYVENGYSSAAVYGLTVGEFVDEELPCFANPLKETETQKANPAHALADYSKHKNSQQKNKGKRLKWKAIARGRLYSQDPA